MRLLLKNVLYFFFYCLNRCIGLFRQRREVSVLMYHAIEDSEWKYSVRVKDFEKQLQYLMARYHIVPLTDIVAFVRGAKELPHRAVALTFDDGYRDTYTAVSPLVKKFMVPITVFLTTDLEKKEKLGNIERLTWDQIQEMHRSGLVRFEVHGHKHVSLSGNSLNGKLLEEEIGTCRSEIEKHLGCRPRYVAYAAGKKSRSVIEFLQRHGFEAGFSINEGLVRKGDDLFSIRRTQVDGTTNFFLFKMRLTGAVDFNRRFVDFWRTVYAKR